MVGKYKGCCLCGIKDEKFLVASHIKPWRACDSGEKLDDENGLLLCPNHDKLFDGGYITFDDSGRILISKEISEVEREILNVKNDSIIELSDENKRYLEYHREHLFKR